MFKWSVQVIVGGVDLSDIAMAKFEARRSDTLAAVRNAGKQVAREALLSDFGSDASIIIFKKLAGDDAPIRDRSFYAYRDRPTRREPDGIRFQAMGN
jgi:hypothetical protein